jgi:hypothetical protein
MYMVKLKMQPVAEGREVWEEDAAVLNCVERSALS